MKKRILPILVLVLFALAQVLVAGELTSYYGVDALVGIMLQNNTDIKKLNEAVVQGQLDVKDAKAGKGPQVDLQVSATYMTNPLIGPIVLNVDDIISSIPGAATFVPPGITVPVYDGMEKTMYQFGLSITQPVFTWGKLNTSILLYEEIAQVRQLQVLDKQGQLKAELYAYLASLYYIGNIRTLIEEQQELAQKLVNLAERAYENGLMLAVDVLQAKIQAKEIELYLLDLYQQESQIMLALRTLTGMNELEKEAIIFEPDEAVYRALLDEDVQQLLAKALSPMQYNLQMVKKLEIITGYARDIAQASVSWKPDFAIIADISYSGSRFPFVETDWYRQNSGGLTLSVGLKTTVWDNGKTKNTIAKADSAVTEATVDSEVARLTIAQTLQDQLLAMEVALNKIEYQQLKQEVSEQAMAQQRLLVDSGYGEEQELIQAEIEYRLTAIEIEKQKLTLATSYYVVKHLTTIPTM